MKRTYMLHLGKGDKSESTRSMGYTILHDNDIRAGSPLLVELSQSFVGRVSIQTTDEQLPLRLRLLHNILEQNIQGETN